MMLDGTFNNITVISWCLTLREIRFKCLNNETVVYVPLTKEMDNMKQPATILVLPVFYQNLPVSQLVQILVNTSIPVSSSIKSLWS
jgi:hypothetical protein